LPPDRIQFAVLLPFFTDLILHWSSLRLFSTLDNEPLTNLAYQPFIATSFVLPFPIVFSFPADPNDPSRGERDWLGLGDERVGCSEAFFYIFFTTKAFFCISVKEEFPAWPHIFSFDSPTAKPRLVVPFHPLRT